MSNSKLICYTKLSPNCTKPRNHKIDTVSIHCMAGDCTVETCGELFVPTSRQASSNYGIGSDGRIAMYVEEANRSWCTSSPPNDHRAVTIEVANDGGASTGWHVSDKALAALIDLCTDICKRNGIKALRWRADKALIGQVDKQNMTVHRWFANKACPGDYLYNLHAQIAAEVNKRLGGASTPTVPENGVQGPSEAAVGDIVTFTGTKHYASSNAINGKSCKPGAAKVTAVAKSGKHPYHLIKTTGGTSTVHGWVDAADIANSSAGTIAKGSSVRVNKGVKTYTGGPLASFVYANTYTVMQVDGSRIVIGQNGVVTAAINRKDLTLVGQ